MPLSKDLVAASASPLILSILERGDSYGYAIIQQVRELSGGEMEWADGMLYPILHRLEKRKLVEAYWGEADNGRKRKYYRLHRSGVEELAALRAHWDKLHGMLQRLEGEARCSI
ncbi:MAG TPA: helix-turn-helix transcriptional regulator [Thermoanaerobaculia bacterium]|nr:helix-turn-helix transcriptional regulator [Thermoanaerobaculia bacterium]